MKRFSYSRHELRFKNEARTSRGVMKSHQVYLLHAEDPLRPGVKGTGEASPLPGLSVDASDDLEIKLKEIIEALNEGIPGPELPLEKLPAINFALEVALAHLEHGGKGKICSNEFINGKPIPINGLIWMADKQSMLASVDKKVDAGFSCIKLKIGALDFDEECRMLESIRKKYSAFRIELRVDANGAFLPDEALEKLNILSRFELHSIEQPVKAGQPDRMQEICAKSRIPVALDEELIGVDVAEGDKLVGFIKPTYLILKPTLLGGLKKADEWVGIARKNSIGWWATSALESNIGLSAIAQWTSSKKVTMPQGLGTGELYENNFPSPMQVMSGELVWLKDRVKS